jgi:glycosyltransferase involved in cell wall biosynthesis
MRILHICAYTWSIGGPARVIHDQTAVMAQQGHLVDILSPMSPGDVLYPAPAGVQVIPVWRTPPLSRVFREYSAGLYRYLKTHLHQYDIVHCHGLWHFGSVAPFWLDRRVAKVVTIHGVLDQWAVRQSRWKKQLMDALLQKRFLNRADLIHLISPDEEADLHRYLGHKHPRALFIPNGIDTADFATPPDPTPFRNRLGLAPGQPIVLFMSRLHVKKGLGLLLPAFRQLLARHPTARLVIAGPNDGYQPTVEAFIREHHLSEHVQLVGMLTGDDKKAALAAADAFVLPSYSEGFSIAVLEAMAAGVACVVSDRVGFGEVIREKQAACLTDTTVDSLQANLDRVLSDGTFRSQIAHTGQTLVQQRYDIRAVANNLLQAYRVCLTRNAA